MDLYHAWCDLPAGASDLAFAAHIERFMEHLRQAELIAGWRLTRRKLGLGVAGLGEFHVMMEVRDLAQLEAAFRQVASRRDPVESLHFGVNALARNAVFALYRDFPIPCATMGRSGSRPAAPPRLARATPRDALRRSRPIRRRPPSVAHARRRLVYDFPVAVHPGPASCVKEFPPSWPLVPNPPRMPPRDPIST